MKFRTSSALSLLFVTETKPFTISVLKLLTLTLLLGQTIISQTPVYEMLVSSRNTHSVKLYNLSTGAYINDFIPTGSGGLNTTQDVIIGPGGNILVSGRGNSAILMYDKFTGSFINSFTSGYTLNNPTKITLGPDGNLYVSQWGNGNQKIVRFNGTTGEFVDEFTQSLNLPLGHAWDSYGNLYAACYGSGDIRKFDTSGNFTGIFTESGYLQGPANLWFDTKGNLFVIDWILGSVLQFNASNGSFIKVFISGIQNAEGYSFGPDSNLYICDWSQNNIKKYTSSGAFLGIFTNQGNLQAPNSILIREVLPIGIEEISGIAYTFKLYQNYPNPFNPSTKISFSLSNRGHVKLKIYDVTGKEIAVLIDGNLNSGSFTAEWNPHNFSAGIYFYKLSNSYYSVTKKMILLK